MKRNKIEQNINKKFDEFLLSITDENVKRLVEKNTIITGGCIASMFLDEKVNDYDLYFTNEETVGAVVKYYTDIVNKKHNIYYELDHDHYVVRGTDYGFVVNLENEDKKKKYQPLYITPNAITLSGQIQIVIRFHGDHEEIHKNFDFVHAQNYWISGEKKVVVNSNALESLLTKDLRYKGSIYPVSSVFRMRKFMRRGWNITAGQILKMLIQVSNLNLNDPSVLKEQVIGVDAEYFKAVLDKLQTNKDDGMVDTEYLYKVLDEVFDSEWDRTIL